MKTPYNGGITTNPADKPFLSTEEIIEHLKNKGVQFNLMSEADATTYLEKNNNFFKLSVYRKNFDKYSGGEHDGQYINLDFAMLKDLAIIDMRLRYIIVQMALDIEHFSKVKLITRAKQENEDGYAIVQEYVDSLKAIDAVNNTSHAQKLKDEINRNANSPYCGGIISKYSGNFSIWAFIEVVSFGTLAHFYKFCADKFKDRKMQSEYYLLMSVKEIRNAAAHSNCFIHDLSLKNATHSTDYALLQKIKTIPNGARNRHLRNEIVKEITDLLYAHSIMVTSQGVHIHTGQMLNQLCSRMTDNASFYQKNPSLKTTYSFFKKVVDIFFSDTYNIGT